MCQLTDGRYFVAETDIKTFGLFAAQAALSQQRWQQQHFENQKRQEELLEKQETQRLLDEWAERNRPIKQESNSEEEEVPGGYGWGARRNG